jgi:predicted O-methyltransferase YrrM
MSGVSTVTVDDLGSELGFAEPLDFAAAWRNLPLRDWVMDADGDILRYLFRNFRPSRHLEFGTWQGDGVIRCVEECDATVWTLNMLEGESRRTGGWVYASRRDEPLEPGEAAETVVTHEGMWVRTDAYGQIGRKYLKAGYGERVCQIYCDSREWDTRQYPPGFFDTAFIDGGHQYDVVANDTARAIQLVRPGGLILWHDYCPLPDVTASCESTRQVVEYIANTLDTLLPLFDRLFWIEPSWLLVGVREQRPAAASSPS